MHPPPGGSRVIAGFMALPLAEWPRLLVFPRRFTRATATGVMHPTHNLLLRYSAALPALLLLLSAPPHAASSPASCRPGHTFWDSVQEACVPCTRCRPPLAPVVLVPCQPHRDVQCGTLSALGIDWSWMRTPQVQRQKRPRPQDHQTSATPRVHPASTSPPHRPGLSRKIPRPRTSTGGQRPETAARVMESRDDPPPPSSRAEEGAGVPSSVRAGVEDSRWAWQHWLVAGVAMAVVCTVVLAFAPVAMRRMRVWERHTCSGVKKKRRRAEDRKRQFNKIEKSDQVGGKGSKGTIEGGHGFYSANQHILLMEEILVRKKAAVWGGSLREESTNVYVEEAPVGVKLVSPASSVLVASIMPSGMVPSVRVEVQGDKRSRNLGTNCLRLGCDSRTVFTGRSSAV